MSLAWTSLVCKYKLLCKFNPFVDLLSYSIYQALITQFQYALIEEWLLKSLLFTKSYQWMMDVHIQEAKALKKEKRGTTYTLSSFAV